jgi:hypothetical protein
MSICSKHRISYIIAQDGQLLGKLTSSKFDSDSLINEFVSYGSKFSSTSIFSQFCQYGGQISIYSPFYEFSSNPPKIFVNGQIYGYLTTNKYISGNNINPECVKQWIKDIFY